MVILYKRLCSTVLALLSSITLVAMERQGGTSCVHNEDPAAIAKMCEDVIESLQDSFSSAEFKQRMEKAFVGSRERALSCSRHLLAEKCWQTVVIKAQNQNNPRAYLLSAAVTYWCADTCKKKDKKLSMLQESFEDMLEAFKGHIATAGDLTGIALSMACVARENGDLVRTKKYIEYCCKLGLDDGYKEAFIEFIHYYEQASPEECRLALEYMEELALQGNTKYQRVLAKIYSKLIQFFAASYTIQADIDKAYNYAYMLVESSDRPDEGHFVMGVILGLYGGRFGVPAGQTERAYALMDSSIGSIGQVSPSCYELLARLSFDLGKYEQAIKWAESAGPMPYSTGLRGLCMLIESEKGNRKYDKNSALDCVEKSLSKARTGVLLAPEYCSLWENDVLLAVLSRDAQAGDLHARTVLARIAYMYADKDIGITKQLAFSYLVEASEAGLASAQSFLGYMFAHGLGLSQSDCHAYEYLSKLLKKKDLPDFVREELAEELYLLGRDPKKSIFHLQVAYDAIVALLQVPTKSNVVRALKLTAAAESALVGDIVHNGVLSACIYISGAWQALYQEAEKDTAFAAELGCVLCRRYILGITDWDTIKTVAVPLIEKVMHSDEKRVIVADIAILFARCIEHAMRSGEKDGDGLRTLCEYALTLDPNNTDLVIYAATIACRYRANDPQYAEFIKRSMGRLDKLAQHGHVLASLNLGDILLFRGNATADFASFKKGVGWLKIAVQNGNIDALRALVAEASLDMKNLSWKKCVNDALTEALNAFASRVHVTESERLYCKGVQALRKRQVDQANGHFDELMRKKADPFVLVAAADALMYKDDLYKRSCGLLMKAAEIAKASTLRERLDVKQAMTQVVSSLGKIASEVPGFAVDLSAVRDCVKAL